MSQIFKAISSTPAVATSYVTDSGTATPAANVLNVLGSDTTANDDDGIRTIGSGNTVTVQLTNRATGSVTTTDATVTTIITLSAGATPGTYIVDNGNICAYDVTDGASGAYFFTAGVRTDGASATEIGSDFPVEFEDAAMAASDIFFDTSGNTMRIRVQGIAGKTINWNASFTYRFVS